MFEIVPNKRLVYKFGSRAYNWRKQELERPGAPRVPCPAQVRFGIYCNLKIYWNLGKKSDLMPLSLGSAADHMEVWRMSTYVSVQQRT